MASLDRLGPLCAAYMVQNGFRRQENLAQGWETLTLNKIHRAWIMASYLKYALFLSDISQCVHDLQQKIVRVCVMLPVAFVLFCCVQQISNSPAVRETILTPSVV